MDDVGTGQNQWRAIQLVSHDIQRIKLSLWKFRQNCINWHSTFRKWDDFAHAHRLEMVVEVVDSLEIAQQVFEADPQCLQQGFYYEEPVRLEN
ncbi:hypothetical protein [Limosilactobacillus kribbianus]|uniref:hypothetical protein n=1 Tax=Limosilactobacillus kribbianus TaxID=2982695 RepID=UPI0022656EF8|nr:hypothetical protein [Limosilactobacillus kribbianus]